MSESSQTRIAKPSVHRTAEARPARVFNGPRPDDARRHGSAAETCRIHLITPATEHAFGQIDIHAGLPQQIQTRLVMGRPGDRYEEEADRAADLVTGSSAPERIPGLAAEPSAPLRRQS